MSFAASRNVESVAHATHEMSVHSRGSAISTGVRDVARHALLVVPDVVTHVIAIDGNGPTRWRWGPRPRPSADQSGKDAGSGVGAPDTIAEQGKEFATDTSLRSGQIRLRCHACVPFMARDEHVQPPGDRIEADQIAVADLADRTALHRFRR